MVFAIEETVMSTQKMCLLSYYIYKHVHCCYFFFQVISINANVKNILSFCVFLDTLTKFAIKSPLSLRRRKSWITRITHDMCSLSLSLVTNFRKKRNNNNNNNKIEALPRVYHHDLLVSSFSLSTTRSPCILCDILVCVYNVYSSKTRIISVQTLFICIIMIFGKFIFSSHFQMITQVE